MKITVKEFVPEVIELPFPKIMISETKRIVLFLNDHDGLVLVDPTNIHKELVIHRGFALKCFKDYTGEVKLLNN